MSVPQMILVLVGAALIAWGVIRVRLRFSGRGLDLPGHRSLHETPVPHGGGLGIVAAVLLVGSWIGVPPLWLAGVAVLAAVSIVDDWRHLPFWLRLMVHLAVAASVVFSHVSGVSVVAVVAVLLIAWAINAYNFMDGADGLAGSMSVTGFSAYAIGFFVGGFDGLALLCVGTVVAALVFLRFNWHPARIFMGDVGSIPLGFLAGGLGWYGVIAGAWPVWFPVLVFSPFLFDASFTLLRRALRGERVWEAHREHYYQRMVRMGCSHAAMCRRWVLLMVLAASQAVIALMIAGTATGWGVLACWTVALAVLARRVDRTWGLYQITT